jgi:hypothetical protein
VTAANDVPTGFRLPRFEDLIGTTFDELTADTIRDAVERSLREDQVLDWKRDFFPGDGRGADKIATLAASYANAQGGVVVFGVEENDRAEAASLQPVPISDEARRRVVDAVVRHVTPSIQGYAIRELRSSEDRDFGFLVLGIPPSPLAPHAVQRNDNLFYPVREDTMSRPMREAEVAIRYRDRFASTRKSIDDLAAYKAQGVARLARSLDVWLCLAAVPEQRGFTAINRAELDRARDWLRVWMPDHCPHTLSVDSAATVGLRRFVFSSDHSYAGVSRDSHIELHADGAFFAAVRLAWQPIAGDRDPVPYLEVKVEDLETWTATFLSVAAGHAARVGGSGELLVAGQVMGPAVEMNFERYGTDGNVIWKHDIHAALADPYEVQGAHFGHRQVPGSLRLKAPSTVEHTVPLTVATDPSELVSATALLAGDIASEFAVAENAIFQASGELTPNGAGPHARALVHGWAVRHGLLSPDT